MTILDDNAKQLVGLMIEWPLVALAIHGLGARYGDDVVLRPMSDENEPEWCVAAVTPSGEVFFVRRTGEVDAVASDVAAEIVERERAGLDW